MIPHIYSSWTLLSFFAPRGKISETLIKLLAFYGFAYVTPIYFSLWYSIITQGFDVVGGLVVASILLPAIIAMSESFKSALLYLIYLPWFTVLILFFLVFIPGYSFARLWDTTWGNRETGTDTAVSENSIKTMKFRNGIFSFLLVLINIGLGWSFIRIFRLGYGFIIGFMFILFVSVIIQLICSLFYLYVLNHFNSRPDEKILQRAFR